MSLIENSRLINLALKRPPTQKHHHRVLAWTMRLWSIGHLLFVVGLVLAMGPALWSGVACAEPSRIILQWTPQSQFAGIYCAEQQGFFSEQGLDVRVLKGGPDRSPAAFVRNGSAEFMTTFLSGALTHVDSGLDLVNLAQFVNRSNLMLVAWKKMGIKTLDDLNQKRVSLWLGGDFEAQFLGLFNTCGISPDILAQHYTVNLFLRGGVAACSAMHYNEFHKIYQFGVERDQLTLFHLQDHGFGLPEDGLYVTRSFYEQHPEHCRSVAAACLKGWEYARDNPEEAVDLVMEHVNQAHIPTNRGHMEWMLNSILKTIFPTAEDSFQFGELLHEDYLRAVDLLTEQGVISSAPDFSRFNVQ